MSIAEINELWEAWTPSEVAHRMSRVTAPWYIAAGWALELFIGDAARDHDDLEIAVPEARFREVMAAFPGFDWDVVGDGQIWPYPDQSSIHIRHGYANPLLGSIAWTCFVNRTSVVSGCAGATRRSRCPTAS
jgi:hypothetical protein